MVIVHKVLPVFLLPLGLGFLIVFLGAVFRKWVVVWLGLLALWLLSMPLFGDNLIRLVEGFETRLAVETLDEADAVVVLGGQLLQMPGVPDGEWGHAVDRFEGGLEVFRAGKAPLLFFMGSKLPWQKGAAPEGKLLQKRALRLGIPRSAVQVSPTVGNTADEAAAVRKMLAPVDNPSVILVTSAFHMRRASFLFRRTGLIVQPFPVDFRTSRYSDLTIIDFLPSAEGLENSELAIREVLGMLYYRVSG